MTPDGAEPLPVPDGSEDVHALLDREPLGIYEALRTFERIRFLGLERHLDRADRSMALLGWSDRLDRPVLRRCLDQAARAWPEGDARIRLDVLAQTPRGLPTHRRVLLALSPYVETGPETLREGVRVGIASEKHRDLPRIKRAAWVVERRGAGPGDRGLYEHLLLDPQGGILECTSANFFAVRGGTLVTADSEMLLGVTRAFVLELAASLGIPVELRAPRVDELGTCEEAFLTSASRNCIPVVEVEGRPVGGGKPGPVTARLRAAYVDLAAREARPAA